jgi:hypothetical protein
MIIMVNRQVLSRLTGLLGAGVFALAVWGLRRDVEPFATWFFSFAWWSYILLADAAVFARQGKSLLMNRLSELPKLALASVTCWLIFELINFSLGNWHYQGVPQSTFWRWLGYAVAFATVLPGIFQTRDLLAAFGVWACVRSPAREPGTAWMPPATIAGLVMLLLPFLWPRYFFPLPWVAFIFLLDPFCYLGGGRSLWADWCRGDRREVYLLLLAGLICGFFWESWNYWAKAKWIYTLPFFNVGRIFEMPVLGYLGFPPFAVECAVMYNFLTLLQERVLVHPWAKQRWLAAQFIFWLIMFAALDRWTVLATTVW